MTIFDWQVQYAASQFTFCSVVLFQLVTNVCVDVALSPCLVYLMPEWFVLVSFYDWRQERSDDWHMFDAERRIPGIVFKVWYASWTPLAQQRMISLLCTSNTRRAAVRQHLVWISCVRCVCWSQQWFHFKRTLANTKKKRSSSAVKGVWRLWARAISRVCVVADSAVPLGQAWIDEYRTTLGEGKKPNTTLSGLRERRDITWRK